MTELSDYDSPITMFVHNHTTKILEDRENAIFARISEEIGLNINKEELIKALNYDRDQYVKGFQAAKRIYSKECGEWVCTVKSNFPQYEPDEYRCSICDGVGHKLDKFCKHCGADMQKEASDGGNT